MEVIRVGFVISQFDWIGGVNYFKNLFSAIQSFPNARIHVVVFTGMKSDVSSIDGLVDIVRSSIFDRKTVPWWIATFLGRVFPKRNFLLYFLLRKQKIDLTSHSRPMWKGCSIPSIGWIADFQHVCLPQFFSKRERAARDKQFVDIMNRCSAVILSSQAALDDFIKFDPKNKTPAYVLRFISGAHHDSSELPSREEVMNKYNLDRSWFHVPNQFWAHKNHKTIIEALRLIKEKGKSLLVVATGSTSDYRNAEYFPSLMNLVSIYGLKDEFRVLGMVPYSDVVALMRYSVAVINPSLFEGWSTSVEESKAMGKTVLLSDIPVHREQAPEWGYYFKADDCESLAMQMMDVVCEFDEEVYMSRKKKAELERLINMRHFSEQYIDIVFDVINRSGKNRLPM